MHTKTSVSRKGILNWHLHSKLRPICSQRIKHCQGFEMCYCVVCTHWLENNGQYEDSSSPALQRQNGTKQSLRSSSVSDQLSMQSLIYHVERKGFCRQPFHQPLNFKTFFYYCGMPYCWQHGQTNLAKFQAKLPI